MPYLFCTDLDTITLPLFCESLVTVTHLNTWRVKTKEYCRGLFTFIVCLWHL